MTKSEDPRAKYEARASLFLEIAPRARFTTKKRLTIMGRLKGVKLSLEEIVNGE